MTLRQCDKNLFLELVSLHSQALLLAARCFLEVQGSLKSKAAVVGWVVVASSSASTVLRAVMKLCAKKMKGGGKKKENKGVSKE